MRNQFSIIPCYHVNDRSWQTCLRQTAQPSSVPSQLIGAFARSGFLRPRWISVTKSAKLRAKARLKSAIQKKHISLSVANCDQNFSKNLGREHIVKWIEKWDGCALSDITIDNAFWAHIMVMLRALRDNQLVTDISRLLPHQQASGLGRLHFHSGTHVDDHPYVHESLENAGFFWKYPGFCQELLPAHLQKQLGKVSKSPVRIWVFSGLALTRWHTRNVLGESVENLPEKQGLSRNNPYHKQQSPFWMIILPKSIAPSGTISISQLNLILLTSHIKTAVRLIACLKLWSGRKEV